MKPADTPRTAFGHLLAEYLKLRGVSGPAELAMLVREKTGYPLPEEVSIEPMRGKRAPKDPTLAHRLAEVLGLERAHPSGSIRRGVSLWVGYLADFDERGRQRFRKGETDGRTDENPR